MRVRILCFSLLAFAAAAPAAAADQLLITPVAVTLQETPIGGRYILMFDVAIDGLRRVSFTASTSEGRNGVFGTRRGEVVPLVLNGDPAPPEAGTSFHIFLETATNRRNDLAFVAQTLPDFREGLFLKVEGEVRAVALAGEEAPVPEGGTFIGFDQVYLVDSGDVYFGGRLLDRDGLPTRAILRATAAGIEPVIAPGDRYQGTRRVLEVLQFEVNQAGDAAALVAIGDADFLQAVDEPAEIVLSSGGHLGTLASVLGEVNRLDLFRYFAVTFDQVNLNDAGHASFFGGSNFFPLGSLYVNPDALFFDNRRMLGQGDPSPASAGDRFLSFGAFGLNGGGTMVLHATTQALSRGGLFLRRGGTLKEIARVGGARPATFGVFSGFRRVEVNESDAFVFTDFQALANVGVFLGRFIPPPQEALAAVVEAIERTGLVPGPGSGLLARVRTLESLLAAGERERLLRLIELLRVELDALARHAIERADADLIDLHLEDLVAAVGEARAASGRGPSRRGPSVKRLTDPKGRG